MLTLFFLGAGLYTVFAPILTGKSKHLKIGLVLLVIAAVLLVLRHPSLL